MARFGAGYFGSARFGVEEVSDYIVLREERNITPHIAPWSESMEECSGILYGDPAKSNGQNILGVGGGWRAAMHYSEQTAYCEVREDGGLFGKKYFRIVDDQSHTWKAFVSHVGSFQLQKGKWYRISVYARSSVTRGSAAYLTYQYNDSRLNTWVSWGVTELGPGRGWVRKEARLYVPEDTNYPYVSPYLYGHINHNNTVSEVDYDGYRFEGPFDSDPGPIADSPAVAVGAQRAEAQLSLLDTTQKLLARSLADSAALSDALAKAISQTASEALGVEDTAWQGFSANLSDALALSESVAKLVAALFGDAATLSDLAQLATGKSEADSLALADALAKAIGSKAADALSVADAHLSSAIQAYREDMLALADAISSAASVHKGDVLEALDSVAKAVARGAFEEAVDLLESYFKDIGLVATVFAEDFTRLDPLWTKYTGTGTVEVVQDETAERGAALRANGYVWYWHNRLIPFDPGLLYELRGRVRQVQDPTTGGKSFYIGLEGVAADGVTMLNVSGANTHSSQHYIAAAGHTQTVAQGWGEWKGYVKGHGTPAGGYHPDPTNPAKMYPGVAYIRPLFILNYSAGNGVADIDFEILSWNLAIVDALAGIGIEFPGEAGSIAEAVALAVSKAVSDLLSVSDSLVSISAEVRPSDALVLADAFSSAVAKALTDTATLADAISSVVGASRSDALALAEALALAFVLDLDVFGRQNLIANGSFEKAFARLYDDGGSKRIYRPENWNVNYYFDNCTEMLVLEETGDVRWGGKAVRMRTNAPDPTNLSLNMTSIRFPIDETTYVEFGARWKSVAGGWTLGDVTFHFYGPSGEYLGRRWAHPTLYEFTEDGGWKFRSWIFRPSDGATLPPGGSGTDPYIPPGSVSAYMQIYFNWHGAGAREGIIDAAFVRVWDHEPSSEERQQAAALADVALADAWLREYAPGAHADAVDILEEEPIKAVTLQSSDLVALTESLAKSAASSLSDALTLAEAVSKAVEALKAEGLTPTDALGLAAAKVLSDVAGIADAVRSAVDAYPGRASLFGLARFGHEYFGNQQPGEAVSLRDAIASEIGFGVLAEDVSALADAIRSAVQALLQDNPTLLDFLAKGLVAPKAESAGASDSVALQVARAVESVVSASDALLNLAASKGITDSVAPLVDALASSAAKVLELSLALGDEAARTVAKGVAEVSLSLAEGIEFGADVEAQSAAYLADAGTRAEVGLAVGGAQFGRAWFGLARFGDAGFPVFTEDELAKAVSAVLQDAATQIDALALQAVKAAASSMALGEALLLAAEKVAGEQANIVDLNAFAVAKDLGLAVAVADDIAKAVAAALQGLSVATADEVQAALAMLRQAHDEMAVVDGAVRAINLLRDELLALADEARRDIEAKRAEALAIASALGKDVAHFPPGDVTGLLDEAQLLGALLAGDLMAPLVDAVTGEVYQVLSQVFINGVSVVTRGLQIKESVASRVGECSFTIPDPSPQVLSLCRQGAEVHVYLSDAGENIVWGGRIVSASVVSASALVREVRIVAQDYATRAQSVLVSGAWVQTKYTDIVKALWQQYAPEDNLVLDVSDNPKVAEKWVVKWESLAEATDRIAQVLGWTWRVDWDGGKKVFRFFDPGAEVHPRALSVANLNIASGTAEFGQDEEIVNSVYVLGGQTLYQPDPYREVADGQKTYFILPARPFEPITVKVDGVEKAWAYETYYWPEGKDCLVHPEGRYVRFQTPPASGSILEVSYQTTKPVRCHLTDPGSIAVYGVHDQVINDSKIADPLQAREAARKILREKAWPKQYGRMEVYEPGLRAGKIVHVYLPDRGIDGLYQVTEMSWTVERVAVRRAISLNRVADAGASIAQVIRNLAQRLAALEAEKDAESPTIDRFIDQSQRLRIAAGTEWLGDIRPPALQTAGELADGHVRAHRSGTVVAAWADGVTRVAIPDSRAVSVMAPRADPPVALACHAKISTSKFGFSRFGEARAGTEVAG